MKRSFIILFMLSLFFISNQNVFATSGCCSSHNGVDCSKVQDNGKVVCNDGNTGSSCLYANQTQCTTDDLDIEDQIGNNVSSEIVADSKSTTSKTNDYKSFVPKTTEALSSIIEYSVIEEISISSTDCNVSAYSENTSIDKESSSKKEIPPTAIAVGVIMYGVVGYLGYKLIKQRLNKNK